MINLSRYLLTLALCAAVFGAVACSDDSSSSAAADDGKKESFTWDDLQVFDAKADLPSCEKFEGVAAQVFAENGFFACVDGEWMPISVMVPAYDNLPKCNASMNNFCVDVTGDEDVDASYICDEGKWVKGRKIEGSELCTKTDENSIEISCMVKSNEFIGVHLGDRWVGMGGVLSENANCKVLTFDDGKKRCKVDVDDYVCSGNWSDGTCDVEGFCMHVEKLSLPEIEEPSLPEIEKPSLPEIEEPSLPEIEKHSLPENEEPCLTPRGLRLNCYMNEKREKECITERYGGEDGIMKNGVCVVDE